MVARGEIYWADLGPPAGRRPVCLLTRDAAAGVRASVTCAPITRTVRDIDSEVEIGPDQGLGERYVINCDNIVTIPKWSLDPGPTGQLDRALRYALDIGDPHQRGAGPLRHHTAGPAAVGQADHDRAGDDRLAVDDVVHLAERAACSLSWPPVRRYSSQATASASPAAANSAGEPRPLTG